MARYLVVVVRLRDRWNLYGNLRPSNFSGDLSDVDRVLYLFWPATLRQRRQHQNRRRLTRQTVN